MFAENPVRLAAALVAALVALAVLTFSPTAAKAFSNAVNGRTGSGCTGCHGSSATGGLGVSISGPSTLLANETTTYTLDIAPGPTGSGGAFDIAIAGGGSLGVVDAVHTQLSAGEITHTSARTNNVGVFSFDFSVTAPATLGALSLAAVGMQFNLPAGNGAEDFWNFAPVFGITVVPEPATGLMTGLGLVGLAVAGRRRRRA